MGTAVIPPAVLAVLLPVAAAAFGVFALVVVGERLLHRRRSRRARSLGQVLAAPSAPDDHEWLARRVGRLTRAQMQQFDLAAMPDDARAALARALPLAQSMEQLQRCVAGDGDVDPPGSASPRGASPPGPGPSRAKGGVACRCRTR